MFQNYQCCFKRRDQSKEMSFGYMSDISICILSLFLTYLAIFAYISKFQNCFTLHIIGFLHLFSFTLYQESVYCNYFLFLSFVISVEYSPGLFWNPEGEVIKSKPFRQKKFQMGLLYTLDQKFSNLSVRNHLGNLLKIYITMLCSAEVLRQ